MSINDSISFSNATQFVEMAYDAYSKNKIGMACLLVHKAIHIFPNHRAANYLLCKIKDFNVGKPLISVVIPTCNRVSILEKSLFAIKNQIIPHQFFEVIVIDDGSIDGTFEKIKSLDFQFSLQLLRQEERQGPARARNRGIRIARGNIILFINDDTILDKDAMCVHLATHENFEDHPVSVLGSFDLHPDFTKNIFGCILQNSDVVFDYCRLNANSVLDYKHYYTCNISSKRDFVIAAGLFDSDFTGDLWGAEDIEFGVRMENVGCPIIYQPLAHSYHYHQPDIKDFVRMFRVRGGGAVRIFVKHQQIRPHYSDINIKNIEFWRNLPSSILSAINETHQLIEKTMYLSMVDIDIDDEILCFHENEIEKIVYDMHRSLWSMTESQLVDMIYKHNKNIFHVLSSFNNMGHYEALKRVYKTLIFLRWFHDTEGVCQSELIYNIGQKTYKEKILKNTQLICDNEKSKRKILLACDFFWPSVGGTENFVEELGLKLLDAGYCVDIACRFIPQRTSNYYKGMHIFSFRCRDRFFDPYIGEELQDFQRTILQGNYKAVIALAHPDTWLYFGLAQLPRIGRPKIIMMPSINAENINEWKNRRVMDVICKILSTADHIVLVSERGHDVQLLGRINVPQTFIPHAVSIRNTKEQSFFDHCPLKMKKPILACVANFWPVKNQLNLIKTLCKDSNDWSLVLAGNVLPWPNEQKYFFECVRLAQNDSRIHFIGPLSPIEADWLIRDIDILLVPSLGESAGPLVVLQAMAHRTPWIATPQCNSVHDEAGGIVVDLENFPKVIQKIVCNKNLYKELSRLGYEHWLRCFTWDKVLPLFLDIIEGKKAFYSLKMPDDIRKRNKRIHELLID